MSKSETYVALLLNPEAHRERKITTADNVCLYLTHRVLLPSPDNLSKAGLTSRCCVLESPFSIKAMEHAVMHSWNEFNRVLKPFGRIVHINVSK